VETFDRDWTNIAEKYSLTVKLAKEQYVKFGTLVRYFETEFKRVKSLNAPQNAEKRRITADFQSLITTH
jgi:hypothetical protein